MSDSLVFEPWPLTWQALLCWPGPLLACGIYPHPLLLMVAQLSPPCGFLVLILSSAMDSTLGTLKVLELPELTGVLRHTALDTPLASMRADSTVECPQISWPHCWVSAHAACLPCSRPSSDLAPSFLLHLSSGAILSRVGDPLCSAWPSAI